MTVVSDGARVLRRPRHRRRRAADAGARAARRRRAGRRRPLPVRASRRTPARRDGPRAGRRVSASASWRATSICCSSTKTTSTDRPLPAGRLREPLAAAAAADAALVTAGYDTAAERVGRALGVATVFRVTRAIGAAAHGRDRATRSSCRRDSRVFAVAGIARPERFFADIAAAGWQVAGTHGVPRSPSVHRARHRADRRRPRERVGAAIVLTTEKDAVRLTALRLGDLPIAAVPLVGRHRAGGRVPRLAARALRASRIRARTGTRHR